MKLLECHMNIGRTLSLRHARALRALCGAFAVALASAPAFAAGKADSAEAQARYQRERATCTNGQSNQDRATCLREAGAAFALAKQGALDDGDAPYLRNATKRCDGLPDVDRPDCMARMGGQGTTSGSVATGGILRELVTRDGVPVSASAASAAAPAK
jgi:hypothetical protein